MSSQPALRFPVELQNDIVATISSTGARTFTSRAAVRFSWRADLSHYEHVNRRSERLCDLVGDRNARALTKPNRRLSGEPGQALGQPPSGGATVIKLAGGRVQHRTLVATR